jgi:hypothetical protein
MTLQGAIKMVKYKLTVTFNSGRFKNYYVEDTEMDIKKLKQRITQQLIDNLVIQVGAYIIDCSYVESIEIREHFVSCHSGGKNDEI